MDFGVSHFSTNPFLQGLFGKGKTSLHVTQWADPPKNLILKGLVFAGKSIHFKPSG